MDQKINPVTHQDIYDLTDRIDRFMNTWAYESDILLREFKDHYWTIHLYEEAPGVTVIAKNRYDCKDCGAHLEFRPQNCYTFTHGATKSERCHRKF